MAKPALPTLIKLAAQEVEKVQKHLTINHGAQAKTRDTIGNWHTAAADAFTTALADADAQEMQAAGLFQGRARSEIARAEALLAAQQATEQTLRTALQAAFTKQKRYEILAEAQALTAKQSAARKAQEALDDLRRKT